MEQEFKFIVDPAEPIFTFEEESKDPEICDDSEDSGEEGDDSSEGDGDSERTLKVRLDKWLWAARFFKTRALARAAVEAGKVFYNGERSKPSREIEIGALLQIRQGRFEKAVTVKGLSTRRRSTDEALQLFEESEESKFMREQQAAFDHPQHQFQHDPFSFSDQRERRSVRFLRRSFGRTPDGRENFDYRGTPDRQPSFPPQYSQPSYPNQYPNHQGHRDHYSSRDQYSNREYHPRDQYSSRDHYSNREQYPREPHSNRDPYPNRDHYSSRDFTYPDHHRNTHSDYPHQGYQGRGRDPHHSQYSNSPYSNAPYPGRNREYSPAGRNREYANSPYQNRNREYGNSPYQNSSYGGGQGGYPNSNNSNREYGHYSRNREYPYQNQGNPQYSNAHSNQRGDFGNVPPVRDKEFLDSEPVVRNKDRSDPKSKEYINIEFEVED